MSASLVPQRCYVETAVPLLLGTPKLAHHLAKPCVKNNEASSSGEENALSCRVSPHRTLLGCAVAPCVYPCVWTSRLAVSLAYGPVGVVLGPLRRVILFGELRQGLSGLFEVANTSRCACRRDRVDDRAVVLDGAPPCRTRLTTTIEPICDAQGELQLSSR